MATWAAGFPLDMGAMVYLHFLGLRCPWCVGNLAPLAMHSGRLSFARNVQRYPDCRRCLDQEVPEVTVSVA